MFPATEADLRQVLMERIFEDDTEEEEAATPTEALVQSLHKLSRCSTWLIN
jgi:hypothetical protein